MSISTSTLHQILLFLQNRILSGEILDLPSIEHESHIRSKIDTASYEFFPFANNRQFFLLMQKVCVDLTYKGEYIFTAFIAEINSIVSRYLKNAEETNEETNENAIIALFLHSLFYSTDPFYPNGLSETLAYLILLHKRCNSELANDLLKLAKFYLMQSILLDEKDECYIDLINFIINPLIGEVQCSSIDFLGLLKNQIDLYNETLSEGSLATQSLPHKVILAENELESFIKYVRIH